jgi:hypothetical protein
MFRRVNELEQVRAMPAVGVTLRPERLSGSRASSPGCRNPRQGLLSSPSATEPRGIDCPASEQTLGDWSASVLLGPRVLHHQRRLEPHRVVRVLSQSRGLHHCCRGCELGRCPRRVLCLDCSGMTISPSPLGEQQPQPRVSWREPYANPRLRLHFQSGKAACCPSVHSQRIQKRTGRCSHPSAYGTLAGWSSPARVPTWDRRSR